MYEHLARTLCVVTLFGLLSGCGQASTDGPESDSDGFNSLLVRHTDSDGIQTSLSFQQNGFVRCREAAFSRDGPSPVTGTTGGCGADVYLEGSLVLTKAERSTFDHLFSAEAWAEYRSIDTEMGLKDTCVHRAEQFAITGADDLHFIATAVDETEFASELVEFTMQLRSRCFE